jgi:hypothetical protein
MRLLCSASVVAFLIGPALAQTDPNVPGPEQRGAVGGLMVPGVPMPPGPSWFTDLHSGSIAGAAGPGLSPNAAAGRAARRALMPGPVLPPRGVIFMPRPSDYVAPGTSFGPSYGGTSGGPGTTSPPSPALESPKDVIPSMGNPNGSGRNGGTQGTSRPR